MIKRLTNAFLYSLAGLRAAYRDEPAFRQECWLTLLLTPTAFFITTDFTERGLLIGTLLLVLLIELINSAIEATIDRISAEKHPLSKKAKDCGSAAVLVALALAVTVWLGVILE